MALTKARLLKHVFPVHGIPAFAVDTEITYRLPGSMLNSVLVGAASPTLQGHTKTCLSAILPAWQRSQHPPWLKKSRKSLRGSWPTPQKESKTSLLRVKNHLFFESGGLFLTLFGGSARTLGDSPETLPKTVFFTF